MDPAFLKLPGEVIRLSMRTHQKYFAVRDPKTGTLAPNFIVVANQVAPDGGKAIAAGNSRVLSARLSDALFFEEQDAKKNLIDYYDKLGTVVFHQKLGSVKDKAERVAALARELAPIVGADADAAEQAAQLAKCDLVTNMVIEFTSLQGQIGRLMYERENTLSSPHPEEAKQSEAVSKDAGGHPDPVLRDAAKAAPQDEVGFSQTQKTSIALAIEEHYKPQGPSDSVPTDPVAVAVALADKLDTLVGFWAIDEKPTGSKDPYALRRAALGVVRIILENGVRLKLFPQLVIHESTINFAVLKTKYDQIIQNALSEQERQLQKDKWKDAREKVETDFDAAIDKLESQKIKGGYNATGAFPVSESLMDFVIERMRIDEVGKGKRQDVFDAILGASLSTEVTNTDDADLVSLVKRVEALQAFLTTDDGANLLAGYKRAANILRAEAKKGDLPDGAPSAGTDPAEQALFAALTEAAPKIEASIAGEDYVAAMTALSILRGPIDAFFDDVMVNSDDAGERENRLRLLRLLQDTARQIADLDKVDG